MADFTQINQEIDDNIKQNGVNEITGAKMNTVLKDMVSSVNNEKQDIISDLDEIRSGAEAGATAFQKPSEGIPSTDMDEQVQAALDNAENAVLYSKQSVGITDQQRNTALANVSNQTANSITGKMGYKVLDPTKTFAEQVTAENTIYEIRDVFDLGDNTVTIPSGCVFKFEGGKIMNGFLEGNLNNKEIYLSWFGGSVAALSKLDISGHTIVFDIPVTFDDTLYIKNVAHVRIDGRKQLVSRSSGSFFICQGTIDDIEIFDFRCQGNLNGDFLAMSTNTISSRIYIHDNYINTIRTGISFNAHNRNENENGSCDGCIAENNTIIGNHLTADVPNYGIHLANANNCIVRGNTIKRVGRHSIYNAYGHNNEFCNNLVEENGYAIDTLHMPAMNVVRDSENIIIRNNVFRNNNGADIKIMGAAYDSDVTLVLDTDVDGVMVSGNAFYHNTSMSWSGKYNIAIGRPSDAYNTTNVVISNNTFNNSSISGKVPIYVETAYNVNIVNNYFYLNGSAIAISLSSTLDPSKSSVFVERNNYYSVGSLTNYVYQFPADADITPANYYAVVHINDNNYCNRRGSSGLNYILYPSQTETNLKNYPNLESGAIIRFSTTKSYEDSFTPATGHYNIIGDLLLVYYQTGTTSKTKHIMGFVCAASGNPGIWRPFGFNAMNFSIYTGGQGYPSGAWDGRQFQSGKILGVAFNNKWYRGDGFNAMNKEGTKLLVNSGTSDDRPSLNTGYDPDYLGFRFYDRTIGKVLHWCHDRWEESDGALAGVARRGESAYRPASSSIYVGFLFFDTTLGKMIVWNGTAWVNLDGTPLS